MPDGPGKRSERLGGRKSPSAIKDALISTMATEQIQLENETCPYDHHFALLPVDGKPDQGRCRICNSVFRIDLGAWWNLSLVEAGPGVIKFGLDAYRQTSEGDWELRPPEEMTWGARAARFVPQMLEQERKRDEAKRQEARARAKARAKA